MSDPFAVLCRGTRLPRHKRKADQPAADLAGAKAARLPSLDFFSQGGAQSSALVAGGTAQRKRRHVQAGSGDAESSSGSGSGSESETGSSDESEGEDEVALSATAYRKLRRIQAKGSDVPKPVQSFEALAGLGVPAPLIARLVSSKYVAPTPIQAQAIPAMLKHRDVLAVAPTGSGKTVAFIVPLLARLQKPKALGFRACIVAPTRELAQQIKRECDDVATGTRLQIRLLDKATASMNSFGPKSSQKFDVLITTPKRLEHAVASGIVSLSSIEWLVLDEADRLFENGFEYQIDAILTACDHSDRRIALFSATMPGRVEQLVASALQDPIRITIGAKNAAVDTIDQRLVFAGREDGKLVALRNMIQEGLAPPALIFVQDQSRATELFRELVYDNIRVDLLHAGRTKKQRDEVVKQFRSGKVWVLICTDLVARGIDFKAVNLVINYDFPPSGVEYIHRIGRTGRAGRAGQAVTFYTEKDKPSLRLIANIVKASGCDVPAWMLSLRKLRKKQRSRTIRRDGISTEIPKKAPAKPVMGGWRPKAGKRRD